MQQLTKSQIIELRARVIDPEAFTPIIEPRPASSLTRQGAEMAKAGRRRKALKQAKATIEADEKAGVLMLVEEGDFKEGDMLDEGDVIFSLKPNMAGKLNAYDYDGNPLYIEACFPIRRANKPVYQCAKEE